MTKDAIEKALKRNAEIDAENIRVSADGGKVTLAGTVHSWDERDEARSAAWNAPGVTEVENDLVVSVCETITESRRGRTLSGVSPRRPFLFLATRGVGLMEILSGRFVLVAAGLGLQRAPGRVASVWNSRPRSVAVDCREGPKGRVEDQSKSLRLFRPRPVVIYRHRRHPEDHELQLFYL